MTFTGRHRVTDPPTDPCFEQRNALEAALSQLDDLLVLIQERTEALIDCEEAHQQQAARVSDVVMAKVLPVMNALVRVIARIMKVNGDGH